MTDLKEVSSAKLFGGHQKVFSHFSEACNCTMKFAIYIPPAVTLGTVSKFPVLYYLPGRGNLLEDFISKRHYQQYAAVNNLVVVACDTSPRDTGLPGESDANRVYGHGAGMYMDSTTPGWKDHYNMFTYVTEELISVVENNFQFVLGGKRGIAGHSMGAHGSLLCALKKPGLYLSVSGTAPVANASTNADHNTPGRPGAYDTYLGTDKETWKLWDVYEVMKSYEGPSQDFLVHIGTFDELWNNLKVWQLVHAVQGKDNINLDLKIKAGYGHVFHFAMSVFEEHIKYHAKILNSQ